MVLIEVELSRFAWRHFFRTVRTLDPIKPDIYNIYDLCSKETFSSVKIRNQDGLRGDHFGNYIPRDLLVAVGKFRQRILRDHVTTLQSLRGVAIRTLLT